jgi:hypothetical protein
VNFTVTFLEPVDQSARFVITGETRLPRDGNIAIPLLKLLNAERISGGAAVEVLGAGEIKDVKTLGFENADASDSANSSESPVAFARARFAYAPATPTSRARLTLNVARYDQQAVLLANIEEARYRVLLSKEGKTLVQARYAVATTSANFVKITLPRRATLWSAALAASPFDPVRLRRQPAPPAREIQSRRRLSRRSARIRRRNRLPHPGPTWNDKGRARIALPALDLPVSRTGLQVYYPPLFRSAPSPASSTAKPTPIPSRPCSALPVNSRARTLR